MLVDDPRSILARVQERHARRILEAGCEDDLAQMETYLTAAMRPARRDFLAVLSGRTEDRVSAAKCVVEAYARRIADTANVRFRARFRMYLESVVESEGALLARPRRVALPHLRLNAVTPLPLEQTDAEYADVYVCGVAVELRRALRKAVDEARATLVRRVLSSVARARARRRLRSLR